MTIVQITGLLGEHSSTILAVLLPLQLVTLVFLLIFAFRLARQRRRIDNLLGNSTAENLEQLVSKSVAEMDRATEERANLFLQIEGLRQQLGLAVQRVGFLRYNAFPGVGGEMSFSIALLDGKHDGFVLTSIFGREEARVYAKPVKAGRAQAVLSDEEQQALTKSLAHA